MPYLFEQRSAFRFALGFGPGADEKRSRRACGEETDGREERDGRDGRDGREKVERREMGDGRERREMVERREMGDSE
jgi:hypothetical protein